MSGSNVTSSMSAQCMAPFAESPLAEELELPVDAITLAVVGGRPEGSLRRPP